MESACKAHAAGLFHSNARARIVLSTAPAKHMKVVRVSSAGYVLIVCAFKKHETRNLNHEFSSLRRKYSYNMGKNWCTRRMVKAEEQILEMVITTAALTGSCLLARLE